MSKIIFLVIGILCIIYGLYQSYLMIKGYGLTWGYTKESLQKELKGDWYKGYSWYMLKTVYPANFIQKMQLAALIISLFLMGFLSIIIELGSNNYNDY